MPRGEEKDRKARAPLRRQPNAALFGKDLRSMMYAFGDEAPQADSVQVMEDILVDYISELCSEAGRVAGQRQKVKVDDFKFALRRDTKKLGRVEELLTMQKEIQQARKLFDEQEG
ncbi:transcription initiation factor IID, 18kD subunit-domain-containing protein [Protomyces lactucae-debilis]|uniref:Transcription initiation factor TFIID subunit 13 n=1 Tax=Protomyces lactucae-debilis TaxID=2754530 RepID=A0A1Y2FU19_PROLT|nr:transcription initiation factor IID, 18kD subunit-domain-containing protein [Protomyces lactucae-debilis]ORY87057.1 transcription initiation factor IID, 18kD subunit-domain-containing protein [Protomyces lactucae-debilis]